MFFLVIIQQIFLVVNVHYRPFQVKSKKNNRSCSVNQWKLKVSFWILSVEKGNLSLFLYDRLRVRQVVGIEYEFKQDFWPFWLFFLYIPMSLPTEVSVKRASVSLKIWILNGNTWEKSRLDSCGYDSKFCQKLVVFLCSRKCVGTLRRARWKNPNTNSIFLQNAQYCTVKACIGHKINPSNQLASSIASTDDHLLLIGEHVSILYKKKDWPMSQLIWFFEFFPVYTLSACTTAISSIGSRIETSTMWSAIALQ